MDRLLDHAGNYLCERALYERAELLLRRVLSYREQALTPHHPETARCLNDLATVYLYQGAYEQAEPLYQHALTIEEQKPEPNLPRIAQILHHLARLYEAQEKYELARPLYQRTLVIRDQTLREAHPDTTSAQADYAHLLHKMQPTV